MSTKEPDEGAQPDGQQLEGPRWEKAEAANRPDGPRWEAAESDDPDAEAPDSDPEA